jgi:hypothetical protein
VDRAALVVEVDELDVVELLELLLEQLAARAPASATIAKGPISVRDVPLSDVFRPTRYRAASSRIPSSCTRCRLVGVNDTGRSIPVSPWSRGGRRQLSLKR